VESKQGSNLLYLPLDKIIQMTAQQGAAAPASATDSSNPTAPAGTAASADIRGRDGRQRDRDGR